MATVRDICITIRADYHMPVIPQWYIDFTEKRYHLIDACESEEHYKEAWDLIQHIHNTTALTFDRSLEITYQHILRGKPLDELRALYV